MCEDLVSADSIELKLWSMFHFQTVVYVCSTFEKFVVTIFNTSARTLEKFLGVYFNTVNYAKKISRTYSSYTTESLYLFKSNPLSLPLEPLTSTVAISTYVTVDNLSLYLTWPESWNVYCSLIPYRAICEAFPSPVNNVLRRLLSCTTAFCTWDSLLLPILVVAISFWGNRALDMFSWPWGWRTCRKDLSSSSSSQVLGLQAPCLEPITHIL